MSNPITTLIKDNVVETLTKAARAGRNVLLEGRYGVGKSTLVLEIAAKLGISMKYFSASTLDPFADLVGIPVPDLESDPRRLLYLRPESIAASELLFFDELNRAPAKVLNAVFELIQFRSINGEKLPKLRSVFAAINPANGNHHVQELDPALIDRFHVYVRLDQGPDRQWFVQEFGEEHGNALVDWYEQDLDAKLKQEVSNRRLEYLGRCLQDGVEPRFAFAPETRVPVHLLIARLEGDECIITIEHFVENAARFSETVRTNLNVAIRFAHVLPMMNPSQQYAVRNVLLALPSDLHTTILKSYPFVYHKTLQAIAKFENQRAADAFRNLLGQRLKD